MAASPASVATWAASASRRLGDDNQEKNASNALTVELFPANYQTASAPILIKHLRWNDGITTDLEGEVDTNGDVRLWVRGDTTRSILYTLRLTPPFYLCGTSSGGHVVEIELLPPEQERYGSGFYIHQAEYEGLKKKIWRSIGSVINDLRKIEFKRRGSSHAAAPAAEDITSILDYNSLLEICLALPASDLCRLAQTCHGFNQVASSDYVWHHLHTRLYGDPQVHMLRWDVAARTAWLSKISSSGVAFPWKEVYRIEHTTEGADEALRACKVVNPGAFKVKGFTRNLGGNVTRSLPFVIKLQADGTLVAKPRLAAGSDYNPSAVSNWVGTVDLASKVVHWDETLDTHSGIFKYSGEVRNGSLIIGKYYWDIKPTAKGTCEFSLVETSEEANRAEMFEREDNRPSE